MKEVFEGFIQPVENLLQNLGVHILVDRKCCLKFGQLCGLIKPVCPVQFSLIETVIVSLYNSRLTSRVRARAYFCLRFGSSLKRYAFIILSCPPLPLYTLYFIL